MKKIHIVGGAGSGKTYLSEILSSKLNISCYDLDDIFWDNSTDYYNKKADKNVRDKKLKDILQNDSWIIEGVYYRWLSESFEKSDVIIILKTHIFIRDFRIIKRFIKRKLGIVSFKKKDTFKGLIELLKWNHVYDKKNLIEIEDMLDVYRQKKVLLKNRNEVSKYISIIVNNEYIKKKKF